jgi:ribulose-phosphate 3-epimerase
VTWEQWIRTVEVEPSLYAADFLRLGEQIEQLLRAGARVFHFDVGDGHFVEPVTIGPVVLDSIAPLIHREGGAIDVHLMVDDPEHYFAALQTSGADSVTFHVEAVSDPVAVAAKARERGLQVGLAIKPDTDPQEAAAVAASFDLVLCMSIHPGYSGQEFLPTSLDRIRWLRSAIPAQTHLQADGGIGSENIRDVHEAGANLLVCGSAIFGMEDLPRSYRRLVQQLA